MSLVTVTKLRVYERAFDHDEARELRAQGWTYRALAERFNVSETAVQRVCRPELAALMAVRAAASIQRKRQPCKGGCGRLVWMHYAGERKEKTSGFCPTCFGKARAASVRETELLCGNCGEWKPDDGFHRNHSNKARRGRHQYCRQCNTVVRREHRQRNREAANKYDRLRRRAIRERTGQMSTFIVLTPNGSGFKEVARVTAASAIGAIEKAVTEPGEYVAVAEGRFKVMRVEPVQKLAVVKQS